MCTDGTCCHIVARVRVNVAVVVDVNSDAGAFGNLRVPRPRFVADATNAGLSIFLSPSFFFRTFTTILPNIRSQCLLRRVPALRLRVLSEESN